MNLYSDLRLVLRRLRASPGYSIAVIGTLALVLGANTAIFSAAQFLLRPIPARAPNELVVGWGNDAAKNVSIVEISFRDFQDWARNSRSFTSVAALAASTWPSVLRGVDKPTRLPFGAVSASFFDVLEVRPILGRTFRPEDEAPNAQRVVVLSYRLWQRLFGGDPTVIGRVIQLDHPHLVIGVMPERFDFPRGAEMWAPVAPILAEQSSRWKVDALTNVGVLFFIGRMREGITVKVASEELDAVAAQVKRDRGRRPGTGVTVIPLVDYLLGPVRQAVWALFGAVVLLLIMACANISGLLLRRAAARQRESAVRLSLGSSMMPLSRIWFIETLLLAVVGGGIGLIVAQYFGATIMALAPIDLAAPPELAFNGAAALFTLGSVTAAALICAAWPMRELRSLNVSDALRDSGRGVAGHGSRMRSALVTVQICLAVILLVAAGLVVRSVINVQRLDFGFSSDRVLTMNVISRAHDTPTVNQWLAPILERVAAMPGVESVGGIFETPFRLGPIGADSWVVLEEQQDTQEVRRQNPSLNYQVATPGYFPTMSIKLVRGRLFTERDDLRAPRVALVSETTARVLWPGRDPIGRRLLLPSQDPRDRTDKWRTVVGVVGDVRYRDLADVRLDVYDAAAQTTVAANNFVVRTSRDPEALARSIRAEINAVDPDAVVDGIMTMDSVVSRVTAPWRFTVRLFGVFAVVASLLAVIGLFGLVSLHATQRSREFALRLAVGADPRHILVLAARSAGRSALIGIVSGVAIALPGSRVIRSMLFEVSTLDVATYAAVIAVIGVVVMVGSFMPALRAARVDPVLLLKGE